MNKPRPALNPHRFARLIAWAQAMLAWVALVLFSPDAPVRRRHIRDRYSLLSLDWIERLVRALVIIRAAKLARLRVRLRHMPRNSASAGFRRRTARGGFLRSAAGSRLRKALKHRDAHVRLQRLSAALADIDAFARRYLVPRARRRLTRLFPVVLVAPPAIGSLSRAPVRPRAADTS